MVDKTYSRYVALENSIERDVELQVLLKRLQEHEKVFREVCAHLCEEDRILLYEYIGIIAEINQRIVEIACFQP